MEAVVISDLDGTCPAAHVRGGATTMLTMLTLALTAVAVIVILSRRRSLRLARIEDNEDYENAMLNASVPTLVTVQNLFASSKRRGVVFGSEMEEADLIRWKCGIAIARVMETLRDDMSADAVLLSPSDLRTELKAEFDDIDYAYVAEAWRNTFDNPSVPPTSDDDSSRASSQDELSEHEYDSEATVPRPDPDDISSGAHTP